jgi:hypothetical protein
MGGRTPRFRMTKILFRLRAAGIHLSVTAGVALLAALVVFGLWYPADYARFSGGQHLFLILIGVDLVLGPLLTLSVFDPRKPWPVLRRDLAVIVSLQLMALAYGLWTVAVARPVHLVFEIDRFRIVHASEVPTELLPRTPPGIEPLPWSGPSVISVRNFKDGNEHFDATMAALQGISLGSRPDLWQSYEAAKADVQRASKPLTTLLARFPSNAGMIEAALHRLGRTAATTAFLPMASRAGFATVLLDPASAEVLGFLDLDSF